MKSIALISAVQAGFGDGARQVRGLFPYEACVENVGPVNVDRGEYACHGHKCSIDTCDDGYHRVALIPGAKKNMKCKHNRKTDSYSWSAPALWSCTSCANQEPLSDDDRFNVQCSYRKVGNYKLKQCTYSCANGQNIYPLNQKKVKNVVCKCHKTEATSHCKWRKGSQTYDEGGAHDFYNWSCPMPHQLPTGLQCTKSNYPASKLVISRPPPSKIVGGEEAVEHSWPWIVRLDIHGGLCGGTILDDKERVFEPTTIFHSKDIFNLLALIITPYRLFSLLLIAVKVQLTSSCLQLITINTITTRARRLSLRLTRIAFSCTVDTMT